MTRLFIYTINITFLCCCFPAKSNHNANKDAANGATTHEKSRQENATSPTSPAPDAITVKQPDGSEILVKAAGNMYIPYAETVDGYTIVKNKQGVYEYALLSEDGDLTPGGLKANDPENRTRKEKQFLIKLKKHLRYQSPKLDELKKLKP